MQFETFCFKFTLCSTWNNLKNAYMVTYHYSKISKKRYLLYTYKTKSGIKTKCTWIQ